jgi:hypothetical protein
VKLARVTRLLLLTLFYVAHSTAAEFQSDKFGRVIEGTVESHRQYEDPFNDVDVDVVFSKGAESWRVPTFWRGGKEWGLRFAPPSPGTYEYHLESTDRDNPDLNGHRGRVSIGGYSGPSELLKHGFPRVSANKRYFELAD